MGIYLASIFNFFWERFLMFQRFRFQEGPNSRFLVRDMIVPWYINELLLHYSNEVVYPYVNYI